MNESPHVKRDADGYVLPMIDLGEHIIIDGYKRPIQFYGCLLGEDAKEFKLYMYDTDRAKKKHPYDFSHIPEVHWLGKFSSKDVPFAGAARVGNRLYVYETLGCLPEERVDTWIIGMSLVPIEDRPNPPHGTEPAP